MKNFVYIRIGLTKQEENILENLGRFFEKFMIHWSLTLLLNRYL